MMAAVRSLMDDALVRVRVMLLFMLLAFLGLGGAMWRIQVAHGDRYKEDLLRQSVRRVRIPGMRGRIYDRNGVCMADNRPSYCIAIYLEELRRPGGWSKTLDHVEVVLDRLASVLGIQRTLTRDEISTHIRKRLPLPLVAWEDVDERVLARFSERVADVPGLDIQVQAYRTYPAGVVGGHVVGYVGRAEPEVSEENPYHYYLPEMAGKSGVEKKFDEVLRGEAGGRLVRVDVSGFRHEDLARRDAKAGSDVRLAIDLEVQRAAQAALGDEEGAAVVLDPRNGDVLAIASSPSLDPNLFVPFIKSDVWARIRNDERKPLIDRAVVEHYAPGSIFKPVVAFAALENDLASPSTTFECKGYLTVGRRRMECWTSGQHGFLNMRQALERSCNVYFFQLGRQIGPDVIYHMAAALGLGAETGISLPYEVPGILPNDRWMREHEGHGWRLGDTLNFSIGQGALAVTPLQMAVYCATIANGGHVYRPRLVLGVREPGAEAFTPVAPQIVNEMNWSRTSIDVVQGGMHDVVMSDRGTGKLARIEGVEMAGKTGTAEYGRKGEGLKRGWMIAYAPANNPRYAVALVMEKAVSGGTTAAPRIKRLMSALFGLSAGEEGQG